MVLVIIASFDDGCGTSEAQASAYAARARGPDRGGSPRTRRRRLKYAAAGLGALLLAGGIYGAITLSGGGAIERPGSPTRIRSRPSRGPRHALCRLSSRGPAGASAHDDRSPNGETARPAYTRRKCGGTGRARCIAHDGSTAGQPSRSSATGASPRGRAGSSATRRRRTSGFWPGLRWPLDPKRGARARPWNVPTGATWSGRNNS